MVQAAVGALLEEVLPQAPVWRVACRSAKALAPQGVVFLQRCDLSPHARPKTADHAKAAPMPNPSAEAWTWASGRVRSTWGSAEGDLVGILREKHLILMHLHAVRRLLTDSRVALHGEALPGLIFVNPYALYQATAMTRHSCTQP